MAEISYASKLCIEAGTVQAVETDDTMTLAIQGKDCLVQKFRNSSVMLEAPHYRPKVSYFENLPPSWRFEVVI